MSSGPPPPNSGSAAAGWWFLINPHQLVITAASVAAGGLACRSGWGGRLGLVIIAGSILSAGLALLSHYFDLNRDRKEHPERPLPSGVVPPATVWNVALACLGLGVGLGLACGQWTGLAALGFSLSGAVFVAIARPIWMFGFAMLGLTRALALLLGASLGDPDWEVIGPAALAAGLYAGGWEMVRCSRQPGAPPTTGFMGLLHISAGLAVLAYLLVARRVFNPLDGLAPLLAAAAPLLPRLVPAVMEPRRGKVLEAVQWGILAMPLLDAVAAAGQTGLTPCLPLAVAWPVLYLLLRRRPVLLNQTPR